MSLRSISVPVFSFSQRQVFAKSAGFTLIELLIALSISTAVVIAIYFFLHQLIGLQSRVKPIADFNRALVMLDRQLRLQFANADSSQLLIQEGELRFLSQAGYRALPPGRRYFHYAFDQEKGALFLRVYDAPAHVDPEESEERLVFSGTVLDRLASVSWSVQRLSPFGQPFEWEWVEEIDEVEQRGTGSAARGQFAAVRLQMEFRQQSVELPPMIYRIGF